MPDSICRGIHRLSIFFRPCSCTLRHKRGMLLRIAGNAHAGGGCTLLRRLHRHRRITCTVLWPARYPGSSTWLLCNIKRHIPGPVEYILPSSEHVLPAGRNLHSYHIPMRNAGRRQYSADIVEKSVPCALYLLPVCHNNCTTYLPGAIQPGVAASRYRQQIIALRKKPPSSAYLFNSNSILI